MFAALQCGVGFKNDVALFGNRTAAPVCISMLFCCSLMQCESCASVVLMALFLSMLYVRPLLHASTLFGMGMSASNGSYAVALAANSATNSVCKIVFISLCLVCSVLVGNAVRWHCAVQGWWQNCACPKNPLLHTYIYNYALRG